VEEWSTEHNEILNQSNLVLLLGLYHWNWISNMGLFPKNQP